MKIRRKEEQKLCVIKRELKFEDYKYCLEETQLGNKINHLKNTVDVKSLRENKKEFIKLILKSQQRFRSEKQNVFTEEVKRIALSANDDKRIQTIDSTETYLFGTGKNLVCTKLD